HDIHLIGGVGSAIRKGPTRGDIRATARNLQFPLHKETINHLEGVKIGKTFLCTNNPRNAPNVTGRKPVLQGGYVHGRREDRWTRSSERFDHILKALDINVGVSPV